ncbi:MAG: HIT family protein [Chromatiales bacterium]|nr:HIT family protein [Chromatiales bacterium]
MRRDPDCIFCKIVAGEIPSFKLFEDEATLAFMDINPANEGHALVIPKEHAPDLYAVSDEALVRTAVTAKRVAAALARTLNPDGLNLVQCNGAAAAQSVMHFHVHVLPRVTDDGLAMNWGLKLGDIDAIGRLAERIRVWM